MTIDPSKLAGIPKMAAGQAISAAAEIEKLCTPPTKPVEPPAAFKPSVPVAAAPPRIVKPDPDYYWVDDYGNLWRQAVEPEIILTLTNSCTVRERDTILNTLMAGRL